MRQGAPRKTGKVNPTLQHSYGICPLCVFRAARQSDAFNCENPCTVPTQLKEMRMKQLIEVSYLNYSPGLGILHNNETVIRSIVFATQASRQPTQRGDVLV
jgi:hypothetical protein